jgi:hypothetical protein
MKSSLDKTSSIRFYQGPAFYAAAVRDLQR